MVRIDPMDLQMNDGRCLHELSWHDRLIDYPPSEFASSYGRCPKCRKLIGEYGHVIFGQRYGFCPACGHEGAINFFVAYGKRPEGHTEPSDVARIWRWALSYEIQFNPVVKYFPTWAAATSYEQQNHIQRAGLKRVIRPEVWDEMVARRCRLSTGLRRSAVLHAGETLRAWWGRFR